MLPNPSVVTASSGNFGQALAYACKLVRKRCTVVMPADSAKVKVDAVREYGATVILDGQGADEITAGYPYHQRAFIKERLLRRQWPAAWSELRAIARREQRSAAMVFFDFFLRHCRGRAGPGSCALLPGSFVSARAVDTAAWEPVPSCP